MSEGTKKGAMDDMIDIHTHILPGIDDGAENLSEALEMAKISRNSGVDVIVATPHCNMKGIFENFYDDEWDARLKVLRSSLEEENISLQILSGMEIYASMDVAEKIERGRLLPLNGSKYYLMEFPFDADPFWMDDVLDSVLQLDKIPLIAHPERYYCVQDEPMILYEWMQQGCVSQLNRGSVFGRFGRHAKSTADLLLNYGLVTCIASDAHSSRQRTTFMGDIKEYLYREYGRAYTEDLLYRNPKRLIADEYISKDKILRPEERIWVPFF